MSRPNSYFNPRTPIGVRRHTIPQPRWSSYFNPRTPIGVRRNLRQDVQIIVDISIHAPRLGCDEERLMVRILLLVFQSTHPDWGATIGPSTALDARLYFNPRTPIGVRHLSAHGHDRLLYFNPRTPIGVRLSKSRSTVLNLQFQSTHPDWGATGPAMIRSLI